MLMMLNLPLVYGYTLPSSHGSSELHGSVTTLHSQGILLQPGDSMLYCFLIAGLTMKVYMHLK